MALIVLPLLKLSLKKSVGITCAMPDNGATAVNNPNNSLKCGFFFMVFRVKVTVAVAKGISRREINSFRHLKITVCSRSG